MIELRHQGTHKTQTYTDDEESVHVDGQQIGKMYTHHERDRVYIAYATDPTDDFTGYRRLGIYPTPQSAIEAILWWTGNIHAVSAK